MENYKRGFLPMRHWVNLSKKQSPKTDEQLRKMFDIPYASAVGSIHSKQDITADSSTDAEYIAALEAAKETVCMENYMQELVVVPSIAEPVVIFYDKNRAITYVKELRSHHISKHILIRYYLLKEMVGRVYVRMHRVTSAENITDY
ncbi:UNVERIFIED_CONTAM: hypothetical protein Sradi_6439100 [Sesamum radiatum]|uniref:Uncharacterized protein n=1 Tax=Sesamum radiatum TaxID=300843 RepID=A0AAW2K5F2_SESRA